MDGIIEDLKRYLATTPEYKKLSDWNELKKYGRIGPVCGSAPDDGTATESAGIMVGRFQPFTVSDLELLRQLNSSTGKKTELVYIRSHQWYENTPFKSATVKKMLERVKESYPELVGSVVRSDKWVDTGVFRMLSGQGAKTYLVTESDHNSLKATVARLSLAMGYEDEFKRCTPECIHEMYNMLRKEITRYSK